MLCPWTQAGLPSSLRYGEMKRRLHRTPRTNIQGVHKVFRQLKKFIDATTDVEMSEMF